jgi:hypothetical protein
MPYKFKPLPLPEELWDLFALNPLTGELFWRTKRRGKSRPNGLAGCTTNISGYTRLVIKGQSYRAHRIVRAWVDGKDPGETLLDHVDQNRQNNQPWNIRPCTSSQNLANVSKRKGYKLLSKNSTYRKSFRAVICLNRKSIHLGYFATAEEARACYIEAKRRLFGEFAP